MPHVSLVAEPNSTRPAMEFAPSLTQLATRDVSTTSQHGDHGDYFDGDIDETRMAPKCLHAGSCTALN